jgi:hypothetical protein
MSFDTQEYVAPLQEMEAEAEQAPAEEAEAEAEGDADAGAERAPAADVDGRARPDVDGLSEHDGGSESDQRARALRGTRHRRATLGLGTQVGPDGQETGAPSASREPRAADRARVQIVAGRGSKLTLAAGATPAEADLFTRVPSGGQRITHRRGSETTPSVEPTMKPENLFIGGAPDSADVRQGGLGNCYFQSCLLALTANDPGRLTSMMAMSGNQVAVTFFRQDRSGNWVQKTINTSSTVLTRRRSDGSIALVGAGMRIAPQPETCEWWAEVNGSTLEVHRRDTYETALWSPMMEKAYADFAQTYGPYGDGLETEDRGKSGYEIIDQGGGSQRCYQLFYGGAATGTTQGIANVAPGASVVAGNIPAIQRLLTYEAQRGNTGPGQTQQFMHARIGADGAVTRGRDLIDAVKAHLAVAGLMDSIDEAINPGTALDRLARLLRSLDRSLLDAQLDALRTVLGNYLATPPTATEQDVATAAQPLFTVDAYHQLWDDTMPAEFRQLRLNLGILANLGSDSGPGRRQVYASHAYHIKRVHLRDAGGADLAITAAEVAARAADIDPQRSSVEVENPHATNEPDLRGGGPTDGVDDGRFDMNLEDFLRSFDLLRIGTVTH